MSEEKKIEKPKPPRGEGKKTDKLIYLGPPMIEEKLHIGYGAVFSNGLPDEIKKRAEADKDFAKLFVPVVDAAKTMKELMKKDSDLTAAKTKVAKDYLNRKRRK